MKDVRLHEGELNVMELLWSNEELAAREIAKIIKEYVGWEKNTTYTVIKRLIDKGVVKKIEPGFLCKALVTKDEIQRIETKFLIDKMFGGSLNNFFTCFLKEEKLTRVELMELQRIINEQEIGNVKELRRTIYY